MAEFNPTKSQQDAILTRGRTVLVSAAAGSGKTKVLTERLLARISDDADIDSFLIITFTKAAAEELKSRITDEIAERLAIDPDNRRLRRQSALCQKAQISTIHSFCSNILRENCHAAGLSPEFKIIEEDRAEAIKARVIERVLDECYEEPTADFLQLVDSVGTGRDDSMLRELVLSLHRKMQSHARPEKWAKQQMELMRGDAADASETPWGKEILGSVKANADYWAMRMEKLAQLAYSESKIGEKYGPSLQETALSLRDFSRALDDGWDRAREFLPIAFPPLGRLVNSPNPELSEYIKAVRKSCQSGRNGAEKMKNSLNVSSAELIENVKKTAPAMCALLELTLKFDKAFSDEKNRRAELDFSDLEHITAALLTDENGQPTPLAREISNRFTEIMVDEYQDVNRVQDTIFSAVSKNGENLFMVGDIKQSIYRFRLADPTIFMEKYLSYADLDTAQGNEPVRIMLQENFRSRSEVIEAANHVFETCMSEKLGDVSYDENAKLRCGAKQYVGEVPVPELILVDTKSGEDEDSADNTTAEARAVAAKIKELMESGVRVADKDSERELRYSDIVILMRSVAARGEIYCRELAAAGIPVLSGQGSGFFESVEISLLVSLLAVIDNPHQDIPLISVLRSPAFGFTADELSEIRAADKNADFYSALCLTAQSSEKCADFLSVLKSLRALSKDTELGELLWHICNELDLMAICSAMPDGEQHCANLATMQEYAKRFESGGFRGLHRFVEWLNKLMERGEEPSRGTTGNAVELMTVHKSKGLEFPVVFLCGTATMFNTNDMRKTVLVHPELGLGPDIIDTRRGIRYPSAAKNAIKQRLTSEMLSEEMRLLYVALTRAKEHLFMTGVLGNAEEKLEKMKADAEKPMPPEQLSLATNTLNWLIYAALADSEGKMKYSIYLPENSQEQQSEAAEETEICADDALVEEIRRRVEFEYPHKSAQSLPSKVTATELKGVGEADEEAASLVKKPHGSFRSPDFMKGEKPLTGTEKGTATHMLLQFVDYEKAQSLDGIKVELTRLTASNHLSARQAEAVEPEAVLRLFESPLGRRIMSADSISREFRFSLLCPAESFFEGGEGENVLLQGVVDCLIEEDGELTVIDYKTDRVYGEALEERAKSYAGQLRAYALAVGRITGKPVKECVLYFLSAGKTVIVEEN